MSTLSTRDKVYQELYRHEVLTIIVGHKDKEGPLLPVLHALQEHFGFVPPETISIIAEELQLSKAEVQGVVSYYPHFRKSPQGKHIFQLCRAESCQSEGGNPLALYLKKKIGCDFHQASEDGMFSLEPVYCLGLCAQSPALMLDGKLYAKVTPEKTDQLLAECFAKAEQEGALS